MNSGLKRGLAWAALSVSAFLILATAPALGTGALYMPEPDPLCGVRQELEIEAVPTLIVSGAQGASVELAVDVTSRVPGAVRANFAYALYDDKGTVLEMRTDTSITSVEGVGRLGRGINVLSGFAPGFYRLHVVAAALSNEKNRLVSETVVYLEVDDSKSPILLSAEEWQRRSAYNVGVSHDPGAAPVLSGDQDATGAR